MKASSGYCVRGEQCTQHPCLGEPTKLRSSSDSPICEACRKAEREKEPEKNSRATSTSARPAKTTVSSPTKQEEGRTILHSSATAEIRALKRELVLSLFTKRGSFWESVKEVRELWGITPRVQIPPSETAPLEPGFPTRFSPSPWLPQEALARYEESGKEWWRCVMHWWVDLRGIQQQVLPEKYRDRGALGDWNRFFAVCVLYDPPETELLAFAAFSDPEPEGFYGSRVPEEADPDESSPHMLTPPIKTLQELTESKDWALDCIIYYYMEQLRSKVTSSGIDPYQLLIELEKDDPGLRESYLQKVERDEARYFIEVDERTTKDDVYSAFRMIRAAQEAGPSDGRPKRNQLVALECAALYELPEWTYKKLAERYDLGSKDTAKRYVEEGQKIREED